MYKEGNDFKQQSTSLIGKSELKLRKFNNMKAARAAGAQLAEPESNNASLIESYLKAVCGHRLPIRGFTLFTSCWSGHFHIHSVITLQNFV